MKNHIGIIIVLKLFNLHIFAINTSFKKPICAERSTQELIEENRKQIKRFLKSIKTTQDLWKPLPLPSCVAPALFDLVLHRRNMNLIEIIITKKIPLHHLRWETDSLFEWLSNRGKSKVMLGIIKLHEKYRLDIQLLINQTSFWAYTPLIAAARTQHRECVRVLLENGNQAHATITEALGVAVKNYKRENKTAKIVKLLCNAGANPDNPELYLNYPGYPPCQNSIQAAKTANLFQVVRILQAYSLHKAKKTYFSLLPVDLLISCFQDHKPEIT